MNYAPDKIRVAVLRGGPSPEYEVSLNTGKNILSNLPENVYPSDILISKNGLWHENGFEKSPQKILQKVDLVLNALHGPYGEDGTVQKILENFQIPFSGSDSFASALSMNKNLSKKVFERHGLKTPFSVSIDLSDLTREKIKEVYKKVPMPFVVKPSSSGSSIGVYVAHSLGDLEESVIASSLHSPSVLIEEFIEGREATCGIIDDFRGQVLYPLLPIEIRHGKNFFDYDSKYSENNTKEFSSQNFSLEESTRIQEMSKEAHRALGLRHYSRSDFIIHPKRGVFILETNSLPGLTEKSLLPKSLKSIGSNMREFIEHLIKKIKR